MMQRLSSLVLALALLLGQATLLVHEYDFSAHKEGAGCSVCLHGTPLASVAVGTFSFALLRVDKVTLFQPVTWLQASIASDFYSARAPPVNVSF